MDAATLGFSTQDLLLRSSPALYPPAGVLLRVGLLAAVGYHLVTRTMRSGAGGRRIVRRTCRVVVVVPLLVLGFLAGFEVIDAGPMGTPLLIDGALLVLLARLLAVRAGGAPYPLAGERAALGISVALMVLCSSWAAGGFAHQTGATSSRRSHERHRTPGRPPGPAGRGHARADELRGRIEHLTAALTETEAHLAELATTRKVVAGLVPTGSAPDPPESTAAHQAIVNAFNQHPDQVFRVRDLHELLGMPTDDPALNVTRSHLGRLTRQGFLAQPGRGRYRKRTYRPLVGTRQPPRTPDRDPPGTWPSAPASDRPTAARTHGHLARFLARCSSRRPPVGMSRPVGAPSGCEAQACGRW
ncbi:hypothetical protein [Kitasatospora sp. KL5]|uniref:hypothetical protein n=1 Tax=Kitasatospora sp. KL5 TaxID=3425125 RepID=UPI003D6F622A